MTKDISKSTQNATLYTKYNPNAYAKPNLDPTPTHINFAWKKNGFFVLEKNGRLH